ncbi:hypothetical protein V8E51_013996 [Hyaloscypha variabilis]
MLSSKAPPLETIAMASPSRTLTERSPFSAVSMLHLATSRAVTNTVAPWPSPELSTGDSCSPLGKNKCWEVIGPALAASVDILKGVKGLLDSRAEYLHEREPKTCFIAFGVYMMGRHESRANPTLLISCERKPPRQKAVKLIRESSILRDAAGFRLADCNRLPLCTASPVLLGGGDLSAYGLFDNLTTNELYCISTSNTCGMPLYTRVDNDSKDDNYSQVATFGGFVSVQNTIYGISTVHSFVENSGLQTSPNEENECEFEFDDQLEGEDDSDCQTGLERGWRINFLKHLFP